ncbi:hypothetical protein Pmani_032934 [Petrolisthes manimaculis]|uniref:Secreted protein n=1 Tax=Petrolisthes manimaculis TaxID=1843537 RepID=A0AAE1TT96_9EUCA|nr:hypothetical protein Pmani_032934 [Petrolisthes manimaculis]
MKVSSCKRMLCITILLLLMLTEGYTKPQQPAEGPQTPPRQKPRPPRQTRTTGTKGNVRAKQAATSKHYIVIKTSPS